MEIFNSSLTILERSMDMRTEAQRVVAANLANIDTPGYKAREMDFAASLQNAIDQVANPVVMGESSVPGRGVNGNNVDLEAELGKMGSNRTLYSVTSQITAAKFRQLSSIFEKEG